MEAAAERAQIGSARSPSPPIAPTPATAAPKAPPGMFDSLAYRNDAATVFRRLIRSLPTRSGVLGVATCDKGLPAMMMALAAMHDLPCVLVPGGVTLLPDEGEDAGRIQTIGARFAHGQITHRTSRRTRLPRLRVAWRRLPVSGNCRDGASGRRGARDVAGALRAGALRPRDLARYGPALGAASCRWSRAPSR